MDYKELLKSDLVGQFKDLPVYNSQSSRIDAIMDCLGRQLNEVYEFFNDIERLRLGTVVDEEYEDAKFADNDFLDDIGNIVCLTRKEARNLVKTQGVAYLSDDLYRERLKFKILKNTTYSYYADTRKAFGYFFDDKKVVLSEDEDIPATIILDYSDKSVLNDGNIGIPIIKAAGVGILFRLEESNEANAYVGGGLSRSVSRQTTNTTAFDSVFDNVYYRDEDNNYLWTDEDDFLEV